MRTTKNTILIAMYFIASLTLFTSCTEVETIYIEEPQTNLDTNLIGKWTQEDNSNADYTEMYLDQDGDYYLNYIDAQGSEITVRFGTWRVDGVGNLIINYRLNTTAQQEIISLPYELKRNGRKLILGDDVFKLRVW
jgi:hypothetical protein